MVSLSQFVFKSVGELTFWQQVPLAFAFKIVNKGLSLVPAMQQACRVNTTDFLQGR